MKRILIGATILFGLGLVSMRLAARWREERQDRSLVLFVDWSEVRDWSTRQGMTDVALLERLHNAGVGGLLLGASTVQDYLWQDFTFSSRTTAETVLRQLSDRSVVGMSISRVDGKFRLLNSLRNWDRLNDLEVGFNPELINNVRKAGLRLILRVNQDPWLAKENYFKDLQPLLTEPPESAFLLNTDDVPGGDEALPLWRSLLESQNNKQLMFEFHPTKATMKLAYSCPAWTYRAHTIASNELKDLTPSQQRSRWRRAVEERSCRFLLIHVSPNDSLSSFLENIYSIRQEFLQHGWEMGWPSPRVGWKKPSSIMLTLESMAAFLTAMVVPPLVLMVALKKKSWVTYWQIAILTFFGACAMAAFADNPLTRVEIVPFRGSRMAFVLSWACCFLVLYSWGEIKDQLLQHVRRMDIAVGLVVAGIVAYVLIRMGNASAGWKPGWEQGLRDRLEDYLIARPRFKEFAVGYPLLLLGLSLRFKAKENSYWQEGRFWIGVGMIGPISSINTFCHIHSPLYLGILRTFNGFALGTIIGLVLLGFKRWGVQRL